MFFSGCTLRCCYCQNHAISAEGFGKDVTPQRLRAIFEELIAQGAHNIDLITASHFVPFLLPALAVIPVTLERSGQSLLYALFFGLACDLLMPTGVFVCFYCLVFLAAAVIAQLLSGQVIVAGFFCSLAANAVGLLLCGLLQILLRTYQQSISTGPALMLMGKELLLSLAATPLAHISFYKVFRLTRSA